MGECTPVNSDEIISMLNALQDVIDSEAQLDNMSDAVNIQTLRKSVRTLAVVQRDILKSILM